MPYPELSIYAVRHPFSCALLPLFVPCGNEKSCQTVGYAFGLAASLTDYLPRIS